MIPKVIHYCWFGRNPLPKLAVKCIESWKKFLPDYEIKEWNEDNFDVNMIPYTKEAYEAKKYAFVSDYARFWILYNYGGLYFDTDVEVIKNMDDIIARGPFMGCESKITTHYINGAINPGLGFAGEAKMPIMGELINLYNRLHFSVNGVLNQKTILAYTTEAFIRNGLKIEDGIQECCGFTIYPPNYFNPMNKKRIEITDNTYTIHHYMASWGTKSPFVRFIRHIKYNIIIPCIPANIVNAIVAANKGKRERTLNDTFTINED